jgi:hypothetical protein
MQISAGALDRIAECTRAYYWQRRARAQGWYARLQSAEKELNASNLCEKKKKLKSKLKTNIKSKNKGKHKLIKFI